MYVRRLEDLNLLIIKELYFQEGYIDAAITKSEVKIYDNQSVDIYLDIYEGPQYGVGSIRWVGNKLFKDEDLNKILQMNKNEPFNLVQLQNNLNLDPVTLLNLGE